MEEGEMSDGEAEILVRLENVRNDLNESLAVIALSVGRIEGTLDRLMLQLGRVTGT